MQYTCCTSDNDVIYGQSMELHKSFVIEELYYMIFERFQGLYDHISKKHLANLVKKSHVVRT